MVIASKRTLVLGLLSIVLTVGNIEKGSVLTPEAAAGTLHSGEGYITRAKRLLKGSGHEPRRSQLTGRNGLAKRLYEHALKASPAKTEIVTDSTGLGDSNQRNGMRSIDGYDFIGKFESGQSTRLAVRGLSEFRKLTESTSGKGIWLLTLRAQEKGAHAAMLIGDTFYDTSAPLGTLKPSRMDWKEVHRDTLFAGREGGNFVAQFFSLSENSINALKTAMDGRLDHVPETQTNLGSHEGYPYDELPLSDGKGSLSERANCLTYLFPFLFEKWTLKYPGLLDVKREMGVPRLNQVPNLQIAFNTEAAAYSGTVIVGENRRDTKALLREARSLDTRNFALYLLKELAPAN